MKVLLLSGYAAQSHVAWHKGLQSMFPHWEWTILTMPPRHFSWRIRGNPLFWSIREREVLEDPSYDVLLATSMVDLACLRGLVPALAAVPSVLYFHENQFAYPSTQRQHSLVEAQMVSLYASLAADQLVFNSAFNRDSFLGGCQDLLGKLPDKVPTGIVADFESKCLVLPVPVFTTSTNRKPVWPGSSGHFPARPLRLVWVGRFEHDKGGELLQKILLNLQARRLNFELAMVGQQFRQSPAVFDQIKQQFGTHIVQFGYLEESASFYGLLAAGDIVISTAKHEFQGLAILEAVAAGCIPVVPKRLVYPEILPLRFCYPSSKEIQGEEAEHAANLIVTTGQDISSGAVTAPDVSAFSPAVLKSAYAEMFGSVVAARA